MPRQTKLNEELQSKICERIRRGVRPEAAAGAEGIGRRTYYEWMQRGGNGEAPFEGFRTAVTHAIDSFEADATERLLGGDDKGESFGRAKAALEVLSRRMPRHWAQQVKHHVETVEDEFLDALQQVCEDPSVFERVRQEKDCRVVFTAFCEALARRESEGAPDGDPGGRAASVH